VAAVACTSGPSCLNWGFESGTTEGWKGDPAGSAGITNITVSSSQAHTGSRSLAISLSIGSFSTSQARGITVVVPLCASSGTINLAGYSFTAWVSFSLTGGSFPSNAANLIQEFTASTDTSTRGTATNPIAIGNSNLVPAWKIFGGAINQASTANSLGEVYVEFPLADPNSEGFSGTMYLDDIQITPP
jgi:hypothetical protein